MKKLIDLIKKNKGKVAFLAFINLFVLLTNLAVWPVEDMNKQVVMWILIFVTIVDLFAILQVWREYKGWEGLFGRNK